MSPRILKRDELPPVTGVSKATLYRLERAGQFPARRQLSAGRVGWLLSEVEEWVNNRTQIYSR